MHRDETAELLAALSNSAHSQSFAPTSTKMGRNGGTFAVKDWSTPRHVDQRPVSLKVIRFFDKGETEGVAVADHAGENCCPPAVYFKKVVAQAELDACG